jgi:uncharacterized protein
VETISLAGLRRLVVAAQGYAPRQRRAGAKDVVGAVRRLSCVQLDSIATVERSHRIALTSRVGRYPKGTVSRLLGEGRLFEYWAHAACLVPVEDWPLFRYRMERLRRTDWWKRDLELESGLGARVLEAIRERGPLASRDFGGANAGPWWNRKPAKEVLDSLWSSGDLVIAGRRGFQRLYDLPERLIPAEYLEQPPPTQEEFLRGTTLRAVAARGALTEAGIVNHYRLRAYRVNDTRPLPRVLDELVGEGALRRLAVDDGGKPVYVAGKAEEADAPRTPVLLTPFDSLLWDRAFAERLFGFRHEMEFYKPQPQRIYGYYVLPFLWGERIAGRADLKADRKDGVLRVLAFHREPRVRQSGALEDAFGRALARLAHSLDLKVRR